MSRRRAGCKSRWLGALAGIRRRGRRRSNARSLRGGGLRCDDFMLTNRTLAWSVDGTVGAEDDTTGPPFLVRGSYGQKNYVTRALFRARQFKHQQ